MNWLFWKNKKQGEKIETKEIPIKGTCPVCGVKRVYQLTEYILAHPIEKNGSEVVAYQSFLYTSHIKLLHVHCFNCGTQFKNMAELCKQIENKEKHNG
jgi:hypothetical protein